jgi:hypothetical protein
MSIDPVTLANLLQGLYACYWCGGVEDMEHIAEHVDNCLQEVRWLNAHVAQTGDKASTQ